MEKCPQKISKWNCYWQSEDEICLEKARNHGQVLMLRRKSHWKSSDQCIEQIYCVMMWMAGKDVVHSKAGAVQERKAKLYGSAMLIFADCQFPIRELFVRSCDKTTKEALRGCSEHKVKDRSSASLGRGASMQPPVKHYSGSPVGKWYLFLWCYSNVDITIGKRIKIWNKG